MDDRRIEILRKHILESHKFALNGFRSQDCELEKQNNDIIFTYYPNRCNIKIQYHNKTYTINESKQRYDIIIDSHYKITNVTSKYVINFMNHLEC